MNQHQPPEQDHYFVLGIDQQATPAEIKKAFHKAALTNHPDKTGGASGEAFVQIKAAYDILSNENSRILYDVRRRDQQMPPPWSYRDPNAKPYSGAFNHNRPTPEQSQQGHPFADFAKTYEEAMRAAEAAQQERAAREQRRREDMQRRKEEGARKREEAARKEKEEKAAKQEAQRKAKLEMEAQRRKVKEMQAEINSQKVAQKARAEQRAAAQERLAAEEQRRRQQTREEEAKKGAQSAKWAEDWHSMATKGKKENEEILRRMKGQSATNNGGSPNRKRFAGGLSPDGKRARFEKEKERSGTQPCGECAATITTLKITIERQQLELRELKTKYDALLRTKQDDSGFSSVSSSPTSSSPIETRVESPKPSGTSTAGASSQNESPFGRAAKEHMKNGFAPLFTNANVPPFRGQFNHGSVYCGRCGKKADHRFTACDEEEL